MPEIPNHQDKKKLPASSRDNAAFVANIKENPDKTGSNAIQIPSITLPKGGGAIKSIDEKFSVNAVNGTAAYHIPLPLTPGRNNFTPSLSLSYSSGAGNSPFGLGWSIDYPSIQCRTDKRLPEYRGEDVYIISLTMQSAGDSWSIRFANTSKEPKKLWMALRYSIG